MSSITSSADLTSGPSPTFGRARLRGVFERAIHVLLFGCAGISVLTTVSIVVVLLFESVHFFFDVSVFEFLTDSKWTPLLKPQHFGILPLFAAPYWLPSDRR